MRLKGNKVQPHITPLRRSRALILAILVWGSACTEPAKSTGEAGDAGGESTAGESPAGGSLSIACEGLADGSVIEMGELGSCTFMTACSERGSRTQMVTVCQDGVAVEQTLEVEEGCERDTESLVASEGDYSECVYEQECSETGTRYRRIIRCIAGEEEEELEEVAEGCDRAREGVDVAVVSEGECAYPTPCATEGVRSQVTRVCLEGSATSVTADLPCQRDTEGEVLEAGSFGECELMEEGVCATSGEERRAVQVCRGGLPLDELETRACTLDPTGLRCNGEFGYSECLGEACVCPASRPDVCEGMCVNLQNDLYACGACGVACGEEQACIEGVCSDTACGDGVLDALAGEACDHLFQVPYQGCHNCQTVSAEMCDTSCGRGSHILSLHRSFRDNSFDDRRVLRLWTRGQLVFAQIEVFATEPEGTSTYQVVVHRQVDGVWREVSTIQESDLPPDQVESRMRQLVAVSEQHIAIPSRDRSVIHLFARQADDSWLYRDTVEYHGRTVAFGDQLLVIMSPRNRDASNFIVYQYREDAWVEMPVTIPDNGITSLVISEETIIAVDQRHRQLRAFDLNEGTWTSQLLEVGKSGYQHYIYTLRGDDLFLSQRNHTSDNEPRGVVFWYHRSGQNWTLRQEILHNVKRLDQIKVTDSFMALVGSVTIILRREGEMWRQASLVHSYRESALDSPDDKIHGNLDLSESALVLSDQLRVSSGPESSRRILWYRLESLCDQSGACLCQYGSTGPDCQTRTFCGNGVSDPLEECDDGNLIDGDGCSSNCEVELGWTCTGVPRSAASVGRQFSLLAREVCHSICGDQIVTGSETCDDGNSDYTDSCADCQIARCGDGFVQADLGEECDEIINDGSQGCYQCRRVSPDLCDAETVCDPEGTQDLYRSFDPASGESSPRVPLDTQFPERQVRQDLYMDDGQVLIIPRIYRSGFVSQEVSFETLKPQLYREGPSGEWTLEHTFTTPYDLADLDLDDGSLLKTAIKGVVSGDTVVLEYRLLSGRHMLALFQKSGDTWSYVTDLAEGLTNLHPPLLTSPVADYLGYHLDGDRFVAMSGRLTEDPPLHYVHTYEKLDGVWQQTPSLTIEMPLNPLGASYSGDWGTSGDYLAFTSPQGEDRLYIFKRSSQRWVKIQTLSDPGGAQVFEYFGTKLKFKGNTIAVLGALPLPNDGPFIRREGCIFVYQLGSDGLWSLVDTITKRDNANEVIAPASEDPLQLAGGEIIVKGDQGRWYVHTRNLEGNDYERVNSFTSITYLAPRHLLSRPSGLEMSYGIWPKTRSDLCYSDQTCACREGYTGDTCANQEP